MSVLKRAIAAGDVDHVRELLDGGMELCSSFISNKPKPVSCFNEGFEFPEGPVVSLLCLCVFIFFKGMDVETRLGFDWTPLMCAVHVGKCELAELLLDRGASANFSRGKVKAYEAALPLIN